MPIIKATYQSTMRRFSIAETATWAELESNLRTLFSLPPTLSFSLSYTDEDGDVITLSTDLEVQDILSNHHSNTPLKFIIVPRSTEDSQQFNNGNITSQTPAEPLSRHVMVTDESEDLFFIPTVPSISKGKQKAAEEDIPLEPSSTDQQKSNEEETKAPFIDLAQRFQTLLEQVRPALDKNPQLVEQANTIMDQILQNIPVDIDMWDQWFKSHFNEFQRQNQNSNNSRQFFSQNIEPWIRRVGQDVFNSSNCPFVGQRQQNDQRLDDEVLDEKLKILHSMGFWEDDAKNIELLEKYSGNIDKVVEVLITIQNEKVAKDELNLQPSTDA
ncbi:pb1 domain containing protein [Gigaspora margarita]|uniref:Pb1 domain containing protein n=1 Tax=Gigaspora margarita TaxID=4874 RepID=A0A8H3ZZZ1_GIGMA|nr:pb1 domain containing protein [Gigaspora margarita]